MRGSFCIVTHTRQEYLVIPMIITTALTHVVTNDWRREHDVDVLAKSYDPKLLVAMLRIALNA